MSQDSPAPAAYVRYADFLAADPARRGNALEFGHDWADGEDRYRACWYAATGELTLERLDPEADLALEDFHRGISGPVEVVAVFASREKVERALGRWPTPAADGPRDIALLRNLAAAASQDA